MKNQIQSLLVALTIFVTGNHLVAQGTAFSYQGRLNDGSAPANGLYDLRFAIFDAATNGNQVTASLTNSDTTVSNGLFTVALDFGVGVFDGNARWLEIGVQTNGGATFVTLTPRQPVTPVTYAIYAESGGSATVLAGGTAIGAGSGNSITDGVSDAFIGGGANNFIQGLGSYSLIGGGYQNTNNGGYATVAGGYGNTVSFANYATVCGGEFNIANSVAATVGGGNGNKASGPNATVGGGQMNAALGFFATVGGGQDNTANSYSATVAGGDTNTASGLTATVSGGYNNIASGILTTVSGGQLNRAVGDLATVGGGDGNTATGVGSFIGGGGFNGVNLSGNVNQGVAAVIGGGLGNSIQANAGYAFIGGGYHNVASGVGSFIGGGGLDASEVNGNINQAAAAAIVGGVGNLILTNANYAFIGGGYTNTASGDYATVPGGAGNIASGEYSFAAGNNAHATNQNSFVWSDGSAQTSDSNTNQFVARASGGFVFYTSATNTGVILPPGSGSWSTMSDRNAKEDFAAVNPQAVLARVASLPLTTWSYKTEQGVRHIGPMAQDFYATFKVGEDNKHIADVDEGGVALAAIQGLNNKMEEQLKARDAEIEQLQQTVAQLKAAMHKLASKQSSKQ